MKSPLILFLSILSASFSANAQSANTQDISSVSLSVEIAHELNQMANYTKQLTPEVEKSLIQNHLTKESLANYFTEVSASVSNGNLILLNEIISENTSIYDAAKLNGTCLTIKIISFLSYKKEYQYKVLYNAVLEEASARANPQLKKTELPKISIE